MFIAAKRSPISVTAELLLTSTIDPYENPATDNPGCVPGVGDPALAASRRTVDRTHGLTGPSLKLTLAVLALQ